MVGLGRFGKGFKPVGVAVLIGGVASSAFADSFYLKNGQVIEGAILKGTFNTLTLVSGSTVQPTSIGLIERVVLTLADGSELSGEPLSWQDGIFEVRAEGKVLRIADGQVLEDEPTSLETTTAEAAPEEAAVEEAVVGITGETIDMQSLPNFTLKNGDEVVGKILHATGSVLTIRPENGTAAPISKAQVQAISFESGDGTLLSGELIGWQDGVYHLRLDGRERLANLPDDVATTPSQTSQTAAQEAVEDLADTPVAPEAEQVDAAILPSEPRPEQQAEDTDVATPAEVGAGGPANETAVAALSTNDAADDAVKETATVPAVSLSDSQHLIETLVNAVDEDGEAVVFKFQLSKPAQRPLVVLYAATEASAKAGEDFEAKSGVITFSTGSTYAEVKVPIIDDDQGEEVEEFNLFLSGDPETIAFSERQIAVTINDND